MKIYVQRTGHMYGDDGELLFTAYSGGNKGRNKEGINNPEMQEVHCVGPIPVGEYSIGAPYDDKDTGLHTMTLTPINGTNCFGRDGVKHTSFKCHGVNEHDAIHGTKTSSEGCICKSPANTRCQIYTKGEKLLTVVAEEADIVALKLAETSQTEPLPL